MTVATTRQSSVLILRWKVKPPNMWSTNSSTAGVPLVKCWKNKVMVKDLTVKNIMLRCEKEMDVVLAKKFDCAFRTKALNNPRVSYAIYMTTTEQGFVEDFKKYQ
jgi:hypothetical protein